MREGGSTGRSATRSEAVGEGERGDSVSAISSLAAAECSGLHRRDEVHRSYGYTLLSGECVTSVTDIRSAVYSADTSDGYLHAAVSSGELSRELGADETMYTDNT